MEGGAHLAWPGSLCPFLKMVNTQASARVGFSVLDHPPVPVTWAPQPLLQEKVQRRRNRKVAQNAEAKGGVWCFSLR